MSDQKLPPEGSQSLDDLVEELYQFLSTSGPVDGEHAAKLLIRLKQRDADDDPRLMQMLHVLGELSKPRGEEPAESTPPEFDFGPAAIDPDAAEHEVSEAVRKEFAPALEEQNKGADEQRAAGAARAKPVEEFVRFQHDAITALRSFNGFAAAMWVHAKERADAGCTWWDECVPGPVRRALEGAASVGAAGGIMVNPSVGLLVAVAVVAFVARRKGAE